mmetsp:Transcript_45892/g.46572  ORF Transcript_45892/g.46572 Transcript_45892/m.46572 type:complete len:226 (-) Transcript_45892:229-906(-)
MRRDRVVLWWTCLIAVYFGRIVLITNGVIYAKSGLAYVSETYDDFELREQDGTRTGNATTLYTCPLLVPVITDAVIEDQFGGLLILAPFMGAAFTCVGVTSLVAAFLYRNLEAGITLLLQAALLSMLGCIVRNHEPDEFYNEGEKDNVQNAQMVAVITGLIGAVGTIVAVVLQQKIPTPIEYFLSLYNPVIVGKENKDVVDEEQLSTIQQTKIVPIPKSFSVSNE